MSSNRSSSYANESININEVCSSTASLSVSTREHDSPTVVSQSSSAYSDQFDDAPEDSIIPRRLCDNPLDALAAMACVAGKSKARKTMHIPEPVIEGLPTASFQISQNDVLCGRGGLTNHHPGNVFFRRLVRMKQESYLLATKREKAGVAKEIVDLIRCLTPPGRFLKKDAQNPGHWIEIGDRKAREKTSQALREGAPELRGELQSAESPDFPKQNVDTINEKCSPSVEPMEQGKCQVWPETLEQHQTPAAVDGTIVSSERNFGNLQIGQYNELKSPSEPHIILDDQSLSPYSKSKSLSYRHPQPVDMEEALSRNCRISDTTVGSKRKSTDDLLDSHQKDSNAGLSNARGPRLKLLKERLRDDVAL
eukprot:CAMPEP_0178913472 /NCGR_PEP_ID=MMETSP0786-20121207/10860_1 /TAXON_ID=186022 /ORGANISM="Thalassionema frauenfeldii, Strain CCMP 1798" /LENGTH=365 /DNA_ID=CAMNT_0020586215 /DNA_START=112 /DNA_END=1212 /DNA_ORIENTATION=-